MPTILFYESGYSIYVLTAMARELATQKGVGEKSDALWKQIQQQHTSLLATSHILAMEPAKGL